MISHFLHKCVCSDDALEALTGEAGTEEGDAPCVGIDADSGCGVRADGAPSLACGGRGVDAADE